MPGVLLLAAATGLSADPPGPAYVGNQACRPCHQAVCDSYARTAMARTSGPALPNLIEGTFRHARSGVVYRVLRRAGQAILTYERPGDPGLHGSQTLEYSVGSNTEGRTFLFRIDGFLYQAPINYYAEKAVWDMSPGYAGLKHMELDHPVTPSCLYCHASRVQAPEPGTVNRYRGDPFLQDGVGCERCHGPGGDHVAGKGPIVNPAKLTGERRAGVCRQCHLEGQASITEPGKRLTDYRPGRKLSDYLATFVYEDAARKGLGAVSHVESLQSSACKRASGDALTCTTCHDPHREPGPAEKADYYRRRCLGCHAGKAEGHHPRQPDCTACHMPKLDSADIGHTVVTDHRIPRRPLPRHSLAPPVGRRLVRYGGEPASDRDLGLAYAEISLRGDQQAGRKALRLLERALPEDPEDPKLLTRLAYLQQARGHVDEAAGLYQRALGQDPDQAVAASNLAVVEARRGRMREALELWEHTFARNPQLGDLGIDLAMGLCAVGDAKDARDTLKRVLRHDPDRAAARRLLAKVGSSSHGCHED